MPELKDLSKAERTEICRSIARAAHDCLAKKEDADGCVQGGEFHARLYKACSELQVIEDIEFSGNSFSKERIAALKEFEETYDQALELAKVYDGALEDQVCLVDFAMPSHTLVRMYCTSRFSSALHKEDSPFANLRVCVAVCEDDVDGSGDENDENAGSESESEEGDGEEDEDDIIVSTSDDSGDSDSSDSDAEEFDDDDGTADDAEICAQATSSDEELGERACKKARRSDKKQGKENDEIQEIRDTDETFAEPQSDED